MSAQSVFRELHDSGCFVMPNPWDRGSARVLQEMGFAALATTSAGHGRTVGKDDQEVTRAELLDHVRDLASFVCVPLAVDSERLFPDAEGGVEATVELLADAGAAGISIEDYNPISKSIESIERATEQVALAVKVAARAGLVVTARAENYLYGAADLDDTISRLLSYRDAGADVLYAPGLRHLKDIERVTQALEKPINVLAMDGGPSVTELADVGVRRVSTGSALHNAAFKALREAASNFR